jgi:hypothetical protein
VDAYAPEVSPGVAIDLGAMSLAAGENTLSLKIIGKNPAGRHPARHYVGVDWFEVEKADAPAPPPSAATVTRLEAESLNASATRGAATPQSLPFMHWSGNAQLMWRGALPEDVLTLPFDATEAGPRELRAALTSASDYADLEIALNGAVVGRLDGWSAEVVTREVNLGVVELAAGRNTLAFRITGRNPKNTQPGKYFAGIDYIEWEPAPPPPAP